MTEFERMQEFAKGALIAELEKIKADLIENPIWVQYRIKGHGIRDITEIVTDVLAQEKNEVIRRLDRELSELKENKQ